MLSHSSDLPSHLPSYTMTSTKGTIIMAKLHLQGPST